MEALTSYDNALLFEKNYTIALINKGDTLSKMGQYQGAVDTYTRPWDRSWQPMQQPGLAAAEQGAASANTTTMIVIAVLVITVAGGAVRVPQIQKT
ncbi:MAG: hypothetical protein MZV70_30600 [Desulfobacterales bacterium]|nr:hypothetical protein [Desulfobacterales bacterium]